MKKLFVIPNLFVLAFSQNKSNQISYTIETTSAKYYLIDSIELINNEAIKVYDSGLQNNFIIPIAEIKTLRQNGKRPNELITLVGTAAGGYCGYIVGFISALILLDYESRVVDIVIISGLGGGAILGNKIGSSIFKRRYKVIEFESWTLDKKINYLKSIVHQWKIIKKILRTN